eukprot:5532171-Pleurochrysis_carterae.AAC.1
MAQFRMQCRMWSRVESCCARRCMPACARWRHLLEHAHFLLERAEREVGQLVRPRHGGGGGVAVGVGVGVGVDGGGGGGRQRSRASREALEPERQLEWIRELARRDPQLRSRTKARNGRERRRWNPRQERD